MPTPTAEVIEKLSMFGVKSREIVQAQRLQFLQSGQVDEGFCKGVCLDWARRVLQGGDPSFEKPGQRIEGDHPSLRRQTLRQATIQLRAGSKKLVGTTRAQRRYNTCSDLIDIYNRNLSRSTVALPADLVTRVTEFFTFTDRPAEYAMTRVDDWINRLNVPEAGPASDIEWRAFAQSMDNYCTQTNKASSRPFTGIRILASTNRDPYASAETAIDTMLGLHQFAAGTVMIAGFGLRLHNGTNSGHAVAMHKLNTGKFMFLDPNYGVFEYTQANLKKALMYLFGRTRTWQRAAVQGGVHDYEVRAFRPIYGEDGDTVTNAVSYMLFGV